MSNKGNHTHAPHHPTFPLCEDIPASGGGLLLFLLSLGVYWQASQQEKAHARLQQQALLLHASLQEAVTLPDRNLQRALTEKTRQLDLAFSQQAASWPAGMLTDWQALKVQWGSDTPAQSAGSTTASMAAAQALQQSCLQFAGQMQAAEQAAGLQASLAFGSMLLLAGGMLLYLLLFMHRQLLRPLAQLSEQLHHLAAGTEGDTPRLYGATKALQQQLAQYQAQLKQLSQQAALVGDGSLRLSQADVANTGLLGKAMLGIQDKMHQFFLDEQRRSWSSKGVEQFARLLREHNQDIESLSKTLISQLVPFVDANQGGIFVLEEEDSGHAVLNLQAAYAWGRHKFLNKTIEIGEGLVGQVAQDRELVLITDVPEDYIQIGSGLGRARPRCILLLPLLTNEQFMGVIELAAFRVFEQHELDFLHKLAENIASTLSSLKTSTQTRWLLEKANAANAHLQAQEEELRQNTEELMATQEAMQKKEMELSGLFASIDYSLFTAAFDLQGQLCEANTRLQQLTRQSLEGLQHTTLWQLLHQQGWGQPEWEALWQRLLAGEPQNLECQLAANSTCWLSASFTPVLNQRGRVSKIMMLATDTSERKQAELTYIAQAEEIIRHEEKLRLYTAELEKLQASLSGKLEDARLEMQRQIEEIAAEKAKNEAILEGCVDGVVSFGEDGVIDFFNKAAEDIWQGTRQQIIGRSIREFIPLQIVYQSHEPQAFYLKDGVQRCLDIRTEVPITGMGGHELEALLTLTRVRVNGAYMFTAFVQKVAVELF
ncbi:PAS domain-containing protein [Cesiribacter andamanensis]|uniref:PAS domain-containing protein n=1 Tax=Cesiribacter andamanensis TaxID=649507 RepID=UPI0006866DEE|nr:GAF domain-containing protein [Cesiribacter andamanensis]